MEKCKESEALVGLVKAEIGAVKTIVDDNGVREIIKVAQGKRIA